MDPRRTGANTLLVQVQDASGEPYDPPSNPVVSLGTEGLDIGEVVLVPVGAGTYRGEVVVPRPGTWEVQVSIRLSRFENPVTTVRLSVSR
jgi:copper transport protein